MDESSEQPVNANFIESNGYTSLLNPTNDMEDFEKYCSSDNIHCEYEAKLPQLSRNSAESGLQTSNHFDWKAHRASCLKSWIESIICSFFITVIGGVCVGVIGTLFIWLNVNLSDNCFNYNDRWYEMPIIVQRTRITVHFIKGMIIQPWSLYCMLAIFGWPLVKKTNLLYWNMFGASIGGTYRLLLYVYGKYNRTWASLPLNFLFTILTLMNGYRIARHFRSNIKQSISLGIKLGGQFYMGILIAFILSFLVIPYYKTLQEHEKAILASFIPAIVIIPKALERVFAETIKGINHPGTSVILLICIYTSSAIVCRVIQADLEKFSLFLVLCIVHGLESTIDKLTLPLRDYIYHRCCTRRHHSSREFRTPRTNRLLADLALVSMITEAGAIIMSCALVQIFRYYYGRDSYGHKYEALTLLKGFLWRALTGIIIENIFNVFAIKIQTFCYNIPVIKVWKLKWSWIMLMIILHTVVAILYFSEILYDASMSRHQLVNVKAILKCELPFRRP